MSAALVMTHSLLVSPVRLKLNIMLHQGTLCVLAAIAGYENWKMATDFRDQLPSVGDFLRRPIDSASMALEVWKLHIAVSSDVTAEKRRRNVEDVMKRSTYRRAHGLESEDKEGMGAFTWTAREHGVNRMPGLRTEGPTSRRRAPAVQKEPAASEADDLKGESKESTHQVPEGNKRHVKKWLGIW